jgi:nitroreductase
MSPEEIKSLGEAFRWAPSSSNQQPWHVVFLTRDSELFKNIASTGLTGFNQAWAPSASVLAVVLARKLEKEKARNQAATYFDVGLASMQMVLEAESMGLRSHFMGGILHDQISAILGAEEFWVTCVVAIGKQASIDGALPELVDREVAVRSRYSPEHSYSINAKLS